MLESELISKLLSHPIRLYKKIQSQSQTP